MNDTIHTIATIKKEMNNIEVVKKIMGLGENFHMCDVSNVSEDGIHLDSWNEDVSNDEFDQIALLISMDGFDITDFELLEIPHPKVFCFGKRSTNQFFDVVKFFDDKWQFSFLKNSNNELAKSIQEAIDNFDYN